MIISGILFTSAGYLIFKRSRIIKKEREIKSAYDFALKKFHVGESMVLGGGATALSLLDIYSYCVNHHEVLRVIEYRFNNAMGDASPMDWFSKVEELIKHGDRSIDTYVSGYAGQAGEDATVKYLNAHGQHAELFEERNHPDNDIISHDILGNHTEYSVKSYSDEAEFKRVLAEHPASTHYAVNSELYNQLENKGLIAQYHSEGIDIIDGHFSNAASRHEAMDTFNHIHQAGDVSHHIPVFGLAVFGVKTIKNFSRYQYNEQSGYEFGVNMIGDFAGVGARSVAGMGGAKAGALIGTMITPGIGTIIGGGIGAIAGAMSASGVVEWFKEKFKWGDIIAALDYYGGLYESGFDSTVKDTIKNSILKYPDVTKALNEEKKLLERYEGQLDPMRKDKVTLPAVLCRLQHDKLNSIAINIDSIVSEAENSIHTLCSTVAAKRGGSQRKFEAEKKRFLGELVVNNPSIFLHAGVSRAERVEYNNQLKSAPNHPYVFSQNPKDIVEGLIYKSYYDYMNNYSNEYKVKSHILLALLIVLLIAGGIYFL